MVIILTTCPHEEVLFFIMVVNILLNIREELLADGNSFLIIYHQVNHHIMIHEKAADGRYSGVECLVLRETIGSG